MRQHTNKLHLCIYVLYLVINHGNLQKKFVFPRRFRRLTGVLPTKDWLFVKLPNLPSPNWRRRKDWSRSLVSVRRQTHHVCTMRWAWLAHFRFLITAHLPSLFFILFLFFFCYCSSHHCYTDYILNRFILFFYVEINSVLNSYIDADTPINIQMWRGRCRLTGLFVVLDFSRCWHFLRVLFVLSIVRLNPLAGKPSPQMTYKASFYINGNITSRLFSWPFGFESVASI